MKLIIGLGNPGKTYTTTRHNIGFVVLDALAEQLSCKMRTIAASAAEQGAATIGDTDVTLAKPLTFMNNSGVAVAAIMKNKHLTPDGLIVIHDDKDLLFGTVKIERNRSAAGHNGVKSIIAHIGTQDFWRVRIGVATPALKTVPTDVFVLSHFSAQEKKELKKLIPAIIEDVKRHI